MLQSLPIILFSNSQKPSLLFFQFLPIILKFMPVMLLLCKQKMKPHAVVQQKSHCTCRKGVITGDSSSMHVRMNLGCWNLRELHSAIRTRLPHGSCTYACIIPSCHSHYSGIMLAAHASQLCRHIVRRPIVYVYKWVCGYLPFTFYFYMCTYGGFVAHFRIFLSPLSNVVSSKIYNVHVVYSKLLRLWEMYMWTCTCILYSTFTPSAFIFLQTCTCAYTCMCGGCHTVLDFSKPLRFFGSELIFLSC